MLSRVTETKLSGEMGTKGWSPAMRSLSFAVFALWALLFHAVLASEELESRPSFRPLVTKESRVIVVSAEAGMITAADVREPYKGSYHLQFITLDPSSLFLPVLLHTDMVFYVHTGKGTVTWFGENGSDSIDVECGDIYRIEEGSIFYVRSHNDPMREKLRIHAIFNTVSCDNPLETFMGAYSNVSDLVRGFDEKILQMGFGVPEEVIKAIKWAEKPPSIVHFDPKNEPEEHSWKEGIFEALMGRFPANDINAKKKKKTKTKTFNLYGRKPDVENCNGWSIAVTDKDFQALRGSDMGVFMVNLTKGAMMGPHWNPRASEIAVVIHGQGMVQVVCPSYPSGQDSETSKCKSIRFRVKEGDIFIVPWFHPMAQMSFNNDSLVFMGFSTLVSKNRPQFLAGKRSVLQVISREILAIAFNAPNTTIERLLASQDESIMLECTSCAEEEERKMEEEIERKREEEEAKREEEEARRREEEERRREEEEAKKREEEKREEEEARRREEEKKARRREEEEAREREEEEARRREEEEEARRREEEEAREREEEEASRRKEEEAREREEEEARRREEEEEARRREEEEAREREEARRREEEEAAREREEGEARRSEEEEAREREEEEARRREEEEAREREEEEVRRREEEQKAIARQEEEAKRQEAARREEEGGSKEQGETKEGKKAPTRKMWRV